MVAALGACSLLTSVSGLSDGADTLADANGSEAGSGEAGGLDASRDAEPTTDAAADGDAEASLPNLHPIGTFENGAKCEPWGFYFATLTRAAVGHTGQSSCRVCSITGQPDGFTADDKGILGPPTIGATYHLSAWLRAVPGSSVATTAFVVLHTIDLPSYAEREVSTSISEVLTDTWLKFEATLSVTTSADALDVVIAGDYAENACFLVDDVVVERIK
jgi:hypothetical protein